MERINEEFRRRTKTQAMLPSANAVLVPLFGLLHSGATTLRKIDGWQDLTPRHSPDGHRAALLRQAA
ncbi:MAG: hypothetical protein IT356_00730 [Gemmatimonadaceae bacterium]|nr:hypothetical protein [Gemmatimonadaceae bacterium]